MKLFFIALFFLHSYLHAEENQFKGYFPLPDGENKIEIFAPFLPLRPSVYILGADQNLFIKYKNYWPSGEIIQDTCFNLNNRPPLCDLIVINFQDNEFLLTKMLDDALEKTAVIFTTTPKALDIDNNEGFEKMKAYLDRNKFVLLSHWFSQEKGGEAIFIKRDIFNDFIKVAEYKPGQTFSLPSKPLKDLETYLRPAKQKNTQHAIDQIDFIYMINLDERKKKFALSSSYLAPHRITPYRFSAVNGWKLPFDTLEHVGVKLQVDPEETWLGTTFKTLDLREYRVHEPLNSAQTFYTLGMTRGNIGNILSHLSVLHDALKSGYRTIWVMEDDIEIVENPHHLSTLIKKLDKIDPDWDILYTDVDSKNHHGYRIPCRSLRFRPNFPIQPLPFYLNKFAKINADFSRIGMRYGAYSMLVRKSGMEKILNFFKKYSFYLPYDMDICLIPNIRMYSVNYDIVSTQPNAPRDITFFNDLLE